MLGDFFYCKMFDFNWFILVCIFNLVIDSGIVNIVNVLIDKIYWRKKGFSDFFKKRKNFYLLFECIVFKNCFMIIEGRGGKEIRFGIINIVEEGLMIEDFFLGKNWKRRISINIYDLF